MVTFFGISPASATEQHEECCLVSSVASEAMGIGESSDVLTVLGGKASCRRKFVLNVHLVDKHGSLVLRDLAVVASVAYAHDHSPVVRDEKPFLAEPPLFTTFNGVEFPAQDRPTRMASGRASFKLAISLLSSKCDNRLFCICFTPQTAAGDVVPISTPCYSKPIRSISRKRTHSSSVRTVSPPQMILTNLDTSPPATSLTTRGLQHNDVDNNGGSGSLGFDNGLLGGTKLGALPSTSSENNDGESGAPPAGRANLQCSSRSSSITSMHYLSPTFAKGVAGMPSKFEGGRNGGHKGGGTVALHESLASAHRTGRTMAGNGLSVAPGQARGVERVVDIETTRGNITGGIASASCSPVSSTPPWSNSCTESMKVTLHPSCSLSLRLSPSDSGSPTSGALTSESSYDEQQQQLKDRPTAATRSQSSPIDIGSSRPCYQAPNFPHPAKVRPFRPFATVGPCKMFMTSDFQLGNGISLATQSAQRCTDVAAGTQAASTNTLLERVHQLREVSPGGGHQQQPSGKVDSVLHSCFTVGTEVRSSSKADDKFNSALAEKSLEEEEKSLQYIEVSLQDVSREVQRRMEDLRSKRRRLLEDEARMHIFQSASWIESLSGRYSL